ncbi:MAG: hypothetical protein CSA96_03190 [Bacteroidetes bacterium]|nr:MAG: hypothetical protein CSA96_03190 [Bacteroidota bacterium]
MQQNLAILAETRMADVIHLDYRLITILGRFGIEFGFGNKSVEEVCLDYGVDCRFFLEITNSFHNPEYFPQKELQRFNVSLILDYLRNTHEFYVEIKIPEIQAYIDEMEENASSNQQKSIVHLNQFFREYTEELREHLSREDESVFPYIRALQKAYESKEVPEDLYQEMLKDPIRTYEKNHDNLEIKLSDLKNLIIKYLPPISSKDCRKLLFELFRLESDLENHARIEDKVLIPKVIMIENELLEYHGS